MGTSKVIFISGLCIIIGVYSYNFRHADSGAVMRSDALAKRIQAEEIAKSGIQHAINKLGTAKPDQMPKLRKRSLYGGVLNYVCDDSGLEGDRIRITSSGAIGGVAITRIAVVNLESTTVSTGRRKRTWNQWVVERAYTSNKEEDYKKSL